MPESNNEDDSTFKDEELLCPLCMEELDISDKNFIPCQCGYQMCRFCWNHIMENLNSRCPACRKPYEKENITFIPPDPEQLAKLQSEKKQRERQRKQQEANNRKHLANVRVIQRNLVYVTNLSLTVAKEETLRKHEFFAQYGKIVKIVVNKNNLYNVNSPHGPSVSAYITYAKKEDALRAIQAVDGCMLDNRILRASFGTTKYCTYFLRGVPCTNPECMYLHELGGEKDSFTKEDMALGKQHFHEQTHPTSASSDQIVLVNRTALPPPPIPPKNDDNTASPETLTTTTTTTTMTTTTPPPPPPTTTVIPTVPPLPMKTAWKQPDVVTTSTSTSTSPANTSETEWPKASTYSAKVAQPVAKVGAEKSLLPATASWGRTSSAATSSTSSTDSEKATLSKSLDHEPTASVSDKDPKSKRNFAMSQDTGLLSQEAPPIRSPTAVTQTKTQDADTQRSDQATNKKKPSVEQRQPNQVQSLQKLSKQVLQNTQQNPTPVEQAQAVVQQNRQKQPKQKKQKQKQKEKEQIEENKELEGDVNAELNQDKHKHEENKVNSPSPQQESEKPLENKEKIEQQPEALTTLEENTTHDKSTTSWESQTQSTNMAEKTEDSHPEVSPSQPKGQQYENSDFELSWQQMLMPGSTQHQNDTSTTSSKHKNQKPTKAQSYVTSMAGTDTNNVNFWENHLPWKGNDNPAFSNAVDNKLPVNRYNPPTSKHLDLRSHTTVDTNELDFDPWAETAIGFVDLLLTDEKDAEGNISGDFENSMNTDRSNNKMSSRCKPTRSRFGFAHEENFDQDKERLRQLLNSEKARYRSLGFDRSYNEAKENVAPSLSTSGDNLAALMNPSSSLPNLPPTGTPTVLTSNPTNSFAVEDWHNSFRALLPNVNVSFSSSQPTTFTGFNVPPKNPPPPASTQFTQWPSTMVANQSGLSPLFNVPSPWGQPPPGFNHPGIQSLPTKIHTPAPPVLNRPKQTTSWPSRYYSEPYSYQGPLVSPQTQPQMIPPQLSQQATQAPQPIPQLLPLQQKYRPPPPEDNPVWRPKNPQQAPRGPPMVGVMFAGNQNSQHPIKNSGYPPNSSLHLPHPINSPAPFLPLPQQLSSEIPTSNTITSRSTSPPSYPSPTSPSTSSTSKPSRRVLDLSSSAIQSKSGNTDTLQNSTPEGSKSNTTPTLPFRDSAIIGAGVAYAVDELRAPWVAAPSPYRPFNVSAPVPPGLSAPPSRGIPVMSGSGFAFQPSVTQSTNSSNLYHTGTSSFETMNVANSNIVQKQVNVNHLNANTQNIITNTSNNTNDNGGIINNNTKNSTTSIPTANTNMNTNTAPVTTTNSSHNSISSSSSGSSSNSGSGSCSPSTSPTHTNTNPTTNAYTNNTSINNTSTTNGLANVGAVTEATEPRKARKQRTPKAVTTKLQPTNAQVSIQSKEDTNQYLTMNKVKEQKPRTKSGEIQQENLDDFHDDQESQSTIKSTDNHEVNDVGVSLSDKNTEKEEEKKRERAQKKKDKKLRKEKEKAEKKRREAEQREKEREKKKQPEREKQDKTNFEKESEVGLPNDVEVEQEPFVTEIHTQNLSNKTREKQKKKIERPKAASPQPQITSIQMPLHQPSDQYAGIQLQLSPTGRLSQNLVKSWKGNKEKTSTIHQIEIASQYSISGPHLNSSHYEDDDDDLNEEASDLHKTNNFVDLHPYTSPYVLDQNLDSEMSGLFLNSLSHNSALQTSNTEVANLEKEVENARKEVKALAEKLMELKLRNSKLGNE